MGIFSEKRKAWMRFLTVLLFCSTLLILIFGTAYARYEENISKELNFTYQAKSDQIYITTVESSEAALAAVTGENTQVIEFVLSNGTKEEEHCTYDQIASLAMFATAGMGNTENYVITLHDGGNSYTAKCQEVLKGSAFYEMYGPGWVYRFCNDAEEEVTWQFSGTNYIQRQMFITVEGTSELPAALNLIASARPGEI
ncbi:MAG: hypothetical protein J6B94_08045 [Lachnospiraceae bacterium]|nr:hypothetical protein [Lachnospiraceae bacterium]